jgi:hypothetical protein
MDKMLTREELKKEREHWDKYDKTNEWMNSFKKSIKTALYLYNKQAALEKRVEGLIEKLKNKLKEVTDRNENEADYYERGMQWGEEKTLEEIIADLEGLVKEGEGNKTNKKDEVDFPYSEQEYHDDIISD